MTANRKIRVASQTRKNVLRFAPNFTAYVLPPDAVCLYSEDRKFFLHGELYCALATAIGKNGKAAPEIVRQLSKSFPADKIEEAIKRMFTPEFRNRLDAIVPFGYLPPEVVARVVDKFILQLELQLADRNVHIDLDEDARVWLANKGYDPVYGARPLKRVIQKYVQDPLAEQILSGEVPDGSLVKVTSGTDRLLFRPRQAVDEAA